MSSSGRVAGARLVPSLMCMSMLSVQRDLETLRGFFEEVHVDIMDGHFCDSIHLSPAFVREIRTAWNGSIDVHLMVDRPGMFVEELAAAGADSIVFHYEASPVMINRLVSAIRSVGVRVGIAVCPSTAIENIADILPDIDRVTVLGVDPGYIGQELRPATMRRVRYLAEARREGGFGFEICVDGGVRWENWHDLAAAGADVLIVGRGGLFDRGPTVRDACVAATTAFHR